MTAEIISGTEISKAILAEIKQEVAEMKTKTGTVPGLRGLPPRSPCEPPTLGG